MMVMKSVNVHLLIINRWCLSSDLVCPVRVYWIWMFPLFSDLIHLKRKLLFCIDNIYIILFIFYLWFVNKEIFVSSASQSLHKDHFGLCEQQWERCVCAQQHTPHLPGGGQPHHGLRRHFTSALCCNLFLCESPFLCVCDIEGFCVYLTVAVHIADGSNCRKLSIHIDLSPITLDYS